MLTSIRTLCVPKSAAFPSVCGSSVPDFALPRTLGHFLSSTGELRVLVVSRRVLVVSVASAAISVLLQVPSMSLYPLYVFEGHPSSLCISGTRLTSQVMAQPFDSSTRPWAFDFAHSRLRAPNAYAWCPVATWIIELYRHGYEPLQLSLGVLGLNLSLRRRSGARTTILVSPASARSPVPSACSTAALDVLTLSPECLILPLAYTVHSFERTYFRCSDTLCSIVVFTGVTVDIRSPSHRCQFCWSSLPALCLTGTFLVRIRVFV